VSACDVADQFWASALTPASLYSSGYFQRAKGRIPMAGNKAPWAPRENYFRDLFALYFGSTRDSLRSYASGTARPVSAAAKKTQ